MFCISYGVKLNLLKHQKVISERDNLASTGLLFEMFIEICLIIPHPNLITNDLYFISNSAVPVEYSINDLQKNIYFVSQTKLFCIGYSYPR